MVRHLAQITGRFAPSPSGELHFGSLVAALGSYLSAKAQNGRWLVRIDDLDPPREMPGAAHTILTQLEHYGLHWDGSVLWQSKRQQAYHQIAQQLIANSQAYFCDCSRKRVQQLGGYYDGYCRHRQCQSSGSALRLFQHQPITHFFDRIHGQITCDSRLASEDYIIKRRDGLYAYNLAVVIDDHFQGVTEIVRGADLIEPSVRQISLYKLLQWPIPDYLHLPVIMTDPINKLSKQNHAPALPHHDPRPLITLALRQLGQRCPVGWPDLTLEQLLKTAILNWDPKNVPLEPALITMEQLIAFSNASDQAMIKGKITD